MKRYHKTAMQLAAIVLIAGVGMDYSKPAAYRLFFVILAFAALHSANKTTP